MYGNLKKIGFQAVNSFLIFKHREIKAFIMETHELFETFVDYNKKKFNKFSEIFRLFLYKTSNMKSFIHPAFLRALSEDKRKSGELSSLYNDLFLKKDELRKIIQNRKLQSERKIDNTLKLSRDIEEVWKELGDFTTEEKTQFKESVESHWNDPLLLESDANSVVQKIKRTYESYRYVNGFYLALFDFISGEKLERIERNYFEEKRFANKDMYFYPEWRKTNKNFYRHDLPCLKEYLTNPKFTYQGLNYVFKWVFEGQNTKIIRDLESHSMDDVTQDRINEGFYCFYSKSGNKYIPINELFKTQNDLFNFFLIIKWVGFLFSTRMMYEYEFLP